MPPKKPISQNLEELEERLIELANAQRDDDDLQAESKQALLTKEGKADYEEKNKEIKKKKNSISAAINNIRNRLKTQTQEEKSQAVLFEVNKRLDEMNNNQKLDMRVTKTRIQRLKEFLKIGQKKEEKEQDPSQSPPSGLRSPGRMSRGSTPEDPGSVASSRASSIVPSGMATPEEEVEPIQYAPIGDFVLRKGRRAKTQQKQQEAEEKKQQEQLKQQEQEQLIQTVRESTQLTDNVNKAEEQGSNTQIITPDYLLTGQQQPNLGEMKNNIPPPNMRNPAILTPEQQEQWEKQLQTTREGLNQINELLNDQVETVPDVINVNQNQIGINESTTRQQEQDKTFQEGELGYTYQKTRQEFYERFQKFKEEFNEPYATWTNEKIKLNNPSSSSSNPDNTNYENNREDKTNQILEVAESVGEPQQTIYDDIETLDDDEFENLYTGLFGQPTQEQPTQEQQLRSRADILSGRVSSGRGLLSGLEESNLGQRLGQIGAGAQAGAIAGARQGMQRGGIRGALEGGAEGGLRGGVAAGIAGQLGSGVVGELAQMGAQAGISDILGRIRRLGAGDDQPDGGVDIKTQIDNINQELSAIKDPLKYPEFKEKEAYRFPGPDEQKKGVQLVQNSVTEYLNDVNLYGGGYDYSPVLDL